MRTDQPVAESGALRIAIGSCSALLLGFGVLTVGDGRRPARPPEAQGPYSPAPSRASLDRNQSVRDQMEYGEEPRPE